MRVTMEDGRITIEEDARPTVPAYDLPPDPAEEPEELDFTREPPSADERIAALESQVRKLTQELDVKAVVIKGLNDRHARLSGRVRGTEIALGGDDRGGPLLDVGALKGEVGNIRQAVLALNDAADAADAADPAGEPSADGVRTWMGQHRDEVERRVKGLGDKVVGLEARVGEAEGRAETAVEMARKAKMRTNQPEQDANASALNKRLGLDSDPDLPADRPEVGIDRVKSDTPEQTAAAVESIDRVLDAHAREERRANALAAEVIAEGERAVAESRTLQHKAAEVAINASGKIRAALDQGPTDG